MARTRIRWAFTAYVCACSATATTLSGDVPGEQDGSPRGALGACCDISIGTCQDLSASDCDAVAGNFQGAGTSCTPNPCPQPVQCQWVGNTWVDQTPPNPTTETWDASESDENTGSAAAEGFTASGWITDVRWYGLYGTPTGACDRLNDDFIITIFEDAAGPGGGPTAPGPRVVCQYTITADRVPASAGGPFGALQLQRFTATLPTRCAAFTGWIQIQAVSDGTTCRFLWMSGKLGDGFSWANGASAAYDLSLCLEGGDFTSVEGACCNDGAGTCQDFSGVFFSCFGAGFSFSGDVTCETVTPPCGQVPGACCDPGTGDCTVETETDCLTAGGVYQGDDTDCSTVACPGAGRCCRDVGQTCDIRTDASCTALGGESWIADATCLSSPCPTPPDNDNCSVCADIVALPFTAVVDTTDATTSNTGTPGSCNSAGAVAAGTQDNDVWWCYTPAADCVLTASAGTDDYDAIFVVYAGSNCAVSELICINEPDSVADPATATFVATAGVTYYFQMGNYGETPGGGFSTFNLDCVSGLGACCFCDTSCQDMDAAACFSAGGVFQGDGNDCATTPCPPGVYCPSSYTNDGTGLDAVADDFISNVTFNTLDNATGPEIGNLSYGDYTGLSTTLVPGVTYTVFVTVESCTDGGPWEQHAWVWIDWDRNCVLGGPGEAYDLGDNLEGGGGAQCLVTMQLDITVPVDALPGPTRMRVIEEFASNPGPCDGDGLHATTWGETEDYTVIVAEGADCSTCLADVGGDNVVNGEDVARFVDVYLGAAPYNACADLNGDSLVDDVDLDPFVTLLLDGTGPCGSASVCLTCLGDAGGDGVLNASDIDRFVQCATGQPDPCPCADMNGDLDVTAADIQAFVDAIINQTGDCP